MPEATSHSRAVIVTGAGHGIGAGVARHLASVGWQVACADLDSEAAGRVAEKIGGIALLAAGACRKTEPPKPPPDPDPLEAAYQEAKKKLEEARGEPAGRKAQIMPKPDAP